MANNADLKFHEEAGRIDKEIDDAGRQCKSIIEEVADNIHIINTLGIEKIIVTDKFTRFSGRLNPIRKMGIPMYSEIEEEVCHLEGQLDRFEDKLKEALKNATDLSRNMMEYRGKILSSHDRLMEARNLADLGRVEMPSLEWIHAVPYPKVKMLEEEWKQLRLDAKISAYNQLLEQQVHASN